MLRLGENATVSVDGKIYTFGRQTLKVIMGFRDYVASKIGDPFALVERFLEKLPAAEAFKLIKEAEHIKEQLDGFSMACPIAKRFLATEEGSARLGQLLLEEHHKDISLEESLRVMKAQGTEIAAVLEKVTGQIKAGQNPNFEGLDPETVQALQRILETTSSTGEQSGAA